MNLPAIKTDSYSREEASFHGFSGSLRLNLGDIAAHTISIDGVNEMDIFENRDVIGDVIETFYRDVFDKLNIDDVNGAKISYRLISANRVKIAEAQTNMDKQIIDDIKEIQDHALTLIKALFIHAVEHRIKAFSKEELTKIISQFEKETNLRDCNSQEDLLQKVLDL